MIDFRKMLSPETLARMDAKRAEIGRLYALGDRWLAEEILKHARLVRQIYPDRLGQDAHVNRSSYSTAYVWNVVPEIAARLGATHFLAGERSEEFRMLSSDALRDWVGGAMPWVGSLPMAQKDLVRGFHPWDLLTTEFVNGNPVVFALDRVAPPSDESKDWCARHMREIARNRGFEPVSGWHPWFNDYEARRAREASLAPSPETANMPSL